MGQDTDIRNVTGTLFVNGVEKLVASVVLLNNVGEPAVAKVVAYDKEDAYIKNSVKLSSYTVSKRTEEINDYMESRGEAVVNDCCLYIDDSASDKLLVFNGVLQGVSSELTLLGSKNTYTILHSSSTLSSFVGRIYSGIDIIHKYKAIKDYKKGSLLNRILQVLDILMGEYESDYNASEEHTDEEIRKFEQHKINKSVLEANRATIKNLNSSSNWEVLNEQEDYVHEDVANYLRNELTGNGNLLDVLTRGIADELATYFCSNWTWAPKNSQIDTLKELTCSWDLYRLPEKTLGVGGSIPGLDANFPSVTYNVGGTFKGPIRRVLVPCSIEPSYKYVTPDGYVRTKENITTSEATLSIYYPEQVPISNPRVMIKDPPIWFNVDKGQSVTSTKLSAYSTSTPNAVKVVVNKALEEKKNYIEKVVSPILTEWAEIHFDFLSTIGQKSTLNTPLLLGGDANKTYVITGKSSVSETHHMFYGFVSSLSHSITTGESPAAFSTLELDHIQLDPYEHSNDS